MLANILSARYSGFMEFDGLSSREDLLIDDPAASQAVIERLTKTTPCDAIGLFLKTRRLSDQMSSVLNKICYLDEVIDGISEEQKIQGSVFVGGVLACMIVEEVSIHATYPRQEIYARWLTNESTELRSLGYGQQSLPTVVQMRKESRESVAREADGAFNNLPQHLRNVVGSYYVNTDRYNNLHSIKIGYGRTLSNLSTAFEECYADTMEVELDKMLGRY